MALELNQAETGTLTPAPVLPGVLAQVCHTVN